MTAKRARSGRRGRGTAHALVCALLLGPAAAQDGAPVGPCSPYRAADGDIPSEMPGCGRRVRPAPGSLADEVDFARRRGGVEPGPDSTDEDAPPPRRHRRR